MTRSLSDEQALLIPELLLEGMTWKQVAAHFGVYPSCISNILAGQTYKHLFPMISHRMDQVRRKLKRLPVKKACSKCGKTYPCTSEFFQPISRRTKFEARCLSCKKKANKARYVGVKTETLIYYGGDPPSCACCGEDTFEFLSIDHINGGGNKHRQALRGKESSIHLWLKRKGFPRGYRVLCMNCNTSLGYHGYCPHQGRPKNG